MSSSWISGWEWNLTVEAVSDACTHTRSVSELELGPRETQPLQCCINKCHLHFLQWLDGTEMEQAGCTAGGLEVSKRCLKSFSTACWEALKIHKGLPKDSMEHWYVQALTPSWLPARSAYQEGSSPKAKIWIWVLKLIQNKLPFYFSPLCVSHT